MPPEPYSAAAAPAWAAPRARGPLHAEVRLPGSKSQTNRELVLAALADGPSRLRHALVARDTDLMVAALGALGTAVSSDGDDLVVRPAPLAGGTAVDVGLAGTLMRFLPPVAALADGDVRFDGDEAARRRPMGPVLGALRALGTAVEGDALPFVVRGTGRVGGGAVRIDASASSQFVSGLLLAGARFERGLAVEHRGARLPSLPHVAMTVDALRRRGVAVEQRIDGADAAWTVTAGPIDGRDVAIEPDLSNAAPFLAAALVVGGTVAVPGWPASTTQAGDRLRELLPAFGARVALDADGLAIDGGAGVLGGGALDPVDLDLGDVSELVPTLAALAAFASGPSRFRGIGHMRGHETDRLAALATELTLVGALTAETEDGLVVRPGPLSSADRPWTSYADHRMATTGALLGLAIDGLEVADIETTRKTLPGFPALWRAMLG